MNIGKLFLTLGVESNVKALDDTIKKVSSLKKESLELNKTLKETKKSFSFSVSSSKSPSGVPSESKILQEEAKVLKAKLQIAKTEADFIKLKEKEQKRAKKEEVDKLKTEFQIAKTEADFLNLKEKKQKRREKDRERATKNFFKQIDNGFSFVAKSFLGALAGAGVAGYITREASKSVSAYNLLQQYGIDPETSQRLGNVFRRGSGGIVGNEDTMKFLGELAQKITNKELMQDAGMISALTAAGISPESIRTPLDLIKSIRAVSKDTRYDPKVFTNLVSALGVPPVFSQALNATQFTDDQFDQAYNLNILGESAIKAGTDISVATSDLIRSYDILKGELLEKFAPEILGIISSVGELLKGEGKIAETGKDVAIGLGGAYAVSKVLGTAAKVGGGMALGGLAQGLLKGGVAGTYLYGAYKGLSYLADKNEEILFPEKYKRKTEKKRQEISKNNGEYYPDFGSGDASIDFNQRLMTKEQAMRMTTINNNNNINVEVKADSVDKNSVPALAEGIGSNINGAVDSRYRTITPPL